MVLQAKGKGSDPPQMSVRRTLHLWSVDPSLGALHVKPALNPLFHGRHSEWWLTTRQDPEIVKFSKGKDRPVLRLLQGLLG
mmetsp:Transcript_51011/g.153343  ORF Transcript_51011/g.153343 Transcript_51011/m.153343 type:complete len:81 (-) Transcript_51011:1268-1510(-)